MDENPGKKSMRDKDLLFSIILIISSIALMVYSVKVSLEAMEVVGCAFYVAPGLPLLVIGGGLLILAVSLMTTAIKQGGDLKWCLPVNLLQNLKKKEFWQTIAVFVYLFLYIFVLWDRIPFIGIHVPFTVATFVFLNLMLITFRATKLPYILIISTATTFLVDFFFRQLANIPLP